MDVPETLLDELKRDEGYRQFPYKDGKGIETIGYGFNLRDTGLPQDEAEHILAMRAGKVVNALNARLPWINSLTPPRRAVLWNQAYNLGVDGLLDFHTYLHLVETGEYEAAAADDMHTLWARQVGPRAKRLATQMATGQWQ